MTNTKGRSRRETVLRARVSIPDIAALGNIRSALMTQAHIAGVQRIREILSFYVMLRFLNYKP